MSLDLSLPDDEDASRAEPTSQVSLPVDAACDGHRIDKFLAETDRFSRTFAQELLAGQRVSVDGRLITANSARVRAGQIVSVDVPDPEPLNVEPEPVALDIIYEDEDVLVIDKPRGLVVHPGPGHTRGTLVAGVLWHLGQQGQGALPGDVQRPGIVHRIDKDTSGLLMVAKSPLALDDLARQLKEHSVTRVYEAIVHGTPAREKGTIMAAVGRDPRHRQRMAVVPEHLGRHAVTHYRLVASYGEYAHLQLRLETGRTHQIRVHMAFIGHPVAGDLLYAHRDPLGLQGQALHAAKLGFTHPRSGVRLEFEAPLPDVLQECLRKLEASKPRSE